jgi:hypothetical protein
VCVRVPFIQARFVRQLLRLLQTIDFVQARNCFVCFVILSDKEAKLSRAIDVDWVISRAFKSVRYPFVSALCQNMKVQDGKI